MRKISIILFILTQNIYAQNINDTIAINEVYVLDNRLNTSLSKENRNVYIINKEEINKLPVQTIQEVLQYATGIDLRQRGNFGSQADISIDGGSFEQTLILINGIKIIDQQTGHNSLNIPFPLEIVDRLEVIRGPAARIYGNNSLTGVINIVTRKPTKNGVYINSFIGTNFQKDIDDTDDIFVNKGIHIGGNLTNKRNQHQIYASHDKGNGYRYNTSFENNKIYYQGDFEFGNNYSIAASYGYVRNSFGANGFYAAPGDKNSSEIVETTLATIQSKHKLTDKWSLNQRFSYRYNFDDYRYFKNNLNIGRSKHYSNSFSGEINSTYKLNKSQIGMGVEYRNDKINSTSIKDHTRNNIGFYIEYKADITDKLNINIGSYINYNSKYNWKLFPGLDLSYAINSNIKLVGSIGTSQRIPTFTDLYLDQKPGNIGNTELKPEKSFQCELGFKFNKKKWTFNTYYFYRAITNFIDWIRSDENDPWQSNNFGKLLTNGVNAKASYSMKFNNYHSLKLSASYTYLDPKFKSEKKKLYSKYRIETLKHQFINTIDYKINKTTISLINRYITRQSYKSYWITDTRINHVFNNKINFFIDTKNIFNTTYYEVGSIPVPSRWLTIGIKYKSL